MNIIESLYLNSIFTLFPILCYLFFVAYNKNVGEGEKKIVLEIALFTSLFLSIKYGQEYSNIEPIVFFNIPLLIGYIKERKLSILIMSIFIISYYVNVFGFNPLLISVEYLIYAFIYLVVKKKGLTNTFLINSFVLIKAMVLSFQTFYLIETTSSDISTFVDILIAILMFYVLSYLILEILNQCENTIDLNVSLKELEKEKKLRKSLFKITHEIKNPIAVCKGYLDMFDYDNREQSEKYIPIIKQEIDRTLTLMNDFLEITKIQVNKDVLDIYLLLYDILDAVDSLFMKDNIEVKVNIPDEELYILGDYNRLKQVFINIIKNAVEAIPREKNGVIEITTEFSKRFLTISIKDNGVGIEPDILEKIEEPFYTTKEKGSGLGLFLSKEIIEAHSGKLKYEPLKEGGTVAIIKLPINYKNPI
ncbi:MAG: HAMP domain-containing sensor histidine kinase [Bacilli bacterium]|nr:HAMP domain-containing sensor histidine kinase [Bacilli bacterium]